MKYIIPTLKTLCLFSIVVGSVGLSQGVGSGGGFLFVGLFVFFFLEILQENKFTKEQSNETEEGR